MQTNTAMNDKPPKGVVLGFFTKTDFEHMSVLKGSLEYYKNKRKDNPNYEEVYQMEKRIWQNLVGKKPN